ncbi:LolA family protein [Lichenihabitans psoromatis]|uniref:LolA family protein n=1 Tax=Lichenihabitans psoromatis TaxID=2528642 RepID=UPI001FDED76B|nr:outer-membrane lipoprotein carrier protein LolA [Lichenihabitans psoromatis]
MMIRIASVTVFCCFVAAAPLHAESGPLQLQPSKKAQSNTAPARQASTLTPAEVVAKANDYLNGAQTMVTDFVQIGADGRRTDGKLYVAKPGHMRFAYAPPATLEIVADGTSVAVIDRKLHTQDLYFISQTPLKFLLNDHIDLAQDTKILDVTSDATGASVVVEDRATFGGTSQIRLSFDRDPFRLKQWTVTDPQGYETVVSLSDVDLATRPDPATFRISTERMLNSKN